MVKAFLQRITNAWRSNTTAGFIFAVSNYGLKEASRIDAVDQFCFNRSKTRLNRKMESEHTISDILSTTFEYTGFGHYSSIQPLQIRKEFLDLSQKVAELDPSRIMEIGTADGGTLYAWCRASSHLKHVISLDLPGGEFGGGYTENQCLFFEEFTNADVNCIRSDSHTESTRQHVSDLLAGNKLDYLFIDGDHTYDGVKSDFEMYSPFVREGGMIAFHDIVDHPNDPDCDVDQFWEEISDKYESEEIIADDDQQWGGIGVIHL